MNLKKYTIWFCLCLSIFGCKAQQNKELTLVKNKDENTLLWKLTGKGIQPSYLFGTMHLLCAEDVVLSKNLLSIMQQVDKIYFELDMDNISELMGGAMNMGMKNGVKLKDLLTPEQYEKVKVFFVKQKSMLPFSMMENFKPLLMASTIMESEMPCKGGISGIEMKMMEVNKANKVNKKEILGLETTAAQLAIFDTIPYSEQAKMLLQYVDSLPNTKSETANLVAAYKEQNIKNITALINKSEPGLENYMDVMLTNRNKNWVAQLQTICKTKTIIAAVGAGHLVGNEGLLNLLKKAGYTLTPLLNK